MGARNKSSQAKPPPRKTNAPAALPQPSGTRVMQEDAAIAAYAEKRRARTPAPSLKFGRGQSGVLSVDNSHTDPRKGGTLLALALGAGDQDFVAGIMGQIVNVTSKGQQPNEDAANFMLSAIKGVQPQDEVETMLAAQMAATHMLTMTFARRLNHVDNIPQQDSASNAINKLMRTFTAQVEALKRYRTGGEQRVTVQHVNVSDGGQAIVGDVLANPRRREGEG